MLNKIYRPQGTSKGEWCPFQQRFRGHLSWFIVPLARNELCCRTLIKRMRPLFEKSGMVFECELVDTVTCPIGAGKLMSGSESPNCHPLISEMRDWCNIMPAGASLKNCYRARKGDADGGDGGDGETFCVPQSFSFMAREGLQKNVQDVYVVLHVIVCHYCWFWFLRVFA